MELVIRVPDEQDLGDDGFDGSFLVVSELALFAEDGELRYEVVPVPGYTAIPDHPLFH